MWPAILAGLRGLMGRAALSAVARTEGAAVATGERGIAKHLAEHRATAATADKAESLVGRSVKRAVAKDAAAAPEHVFVESKGRGVDRAEAVAQPGPQKNTFFGNFQAGLKKIAEEKAVGAANWIDRSRFGQIYNSANELAHFRPFDENDKSQPQFQPNINPNYPNLNREHINQLKAIGASDRQFADTDEAARLDQKEKEAQQNLIDNTKKLTSSFTKLLLLDIPGAALGIAGFSRAMTAANGMYLDSQTQRYGMYNATFATMGVERNISQMMIDRRVAAATSGSANMLNISQLQGENKWAEISMSLKTMTNILATIGQQASNRIADAIMGAFTALGLKGAAKAFEELLGAQKSSSLMSEAITTAILAQKTSREDKRRKPLKPVK